VPRVDIDNYDGATTARHSAGACLLQR